MYIFVITNTYHNLNTGVKAWVCDKWQRRPRSLKDTWEVFRHPGGTINVVTCISAVISESSKITAWQTARCVYRKQTLLLEHS